MATEPLKSAENMEKSPEDAARERLKHALSHLQRAVQQRLKDAAAIEAAANDDTQWQETVDALEAEANSLKNENARLADALKTSEPNADTTAMAAAVKDVSAALDEAIASVEKILKR